MRFQKRQRAGAGLGGGFGVVAGAHVAIKAVAGVVVPMNLDFGVRGADFLDLFGRDVRVELSEVKLDGGVGSFGGEVADAACVVADGGVGVKAGGAEPGEQATEAVANDSSLF